MPDYFTHTIAAEKIYEKLGGEIKHQINSKTLYLLGAQGGDTFFAYNMKFSQGNLGRALHQLKAVDVFKKLAQGNPSYIAGYATHYALDSTIHPIIYAYEEGKRSPFAHNKFEADLGLYTSKYFRIRRTILPRDKVLACTGPIYDSLKLLEPTITVTGVERCLKRHFSYTRYLYRTKKQTYRCEYDFSSFAGVIEEAIDFGVTCIGYLLNGDIDEEVFGRDFLQR